MTEQELMDAIERFFGDQSRSPEETCEGLENAASLIETFLGALED